MKIQCDQKLCDFSDNPVYTQKAMKNYTLFPLFDCLP